MGENEALVAAGDGEIFVRAVGGADARASVLIAVHGGPGISHEPLEALEALSSPRRVVVTYDQRRVGRTTGTVDESRVFDQAVDDLDAVQRSFGSPRVHVLGHSYGGLLAALYAARHADRVASLSLVDSIPATSQELEQAMKTQRARLAAFQARGLVPADLPSWEEDARARLLALWPIYFVDPRHPGARSLGGARLSARAAAAGNRALNEYDMTAELARVTAPTLHFIASVPFGSAMAQAMARALPNAPSRRILLTAAGHLPFIEQPDAFVAELERFLAEIEGAEDVESMDKTPGPEPKSEDGPFRRAQG